MSTVSKVDERRAALDEGREALEVLLAYEDFNTGLRAKQALEQVVRQLKPDADFHLNLWRFDLLREPALLEQAADEATQADIVFLSAHGQSELPVAVRLWFNEWLTGQGGLPRALAVSLDPSARDRPAANQMLEGLRAAARPAGVEVFLHINDVTQTELESSCENVHAAGVARTALLDGVLDRVQPQPPRESRISG